jgi:hypothetical protein
MLRERSWMSLGLVVAGLLVAGCAKSAQLSALRAAIDEGQVEGLTASDHGGYGWPEFHWREFTDVAAFPVDIFAGPHKGTKLYVVVGRSSNSGQWEVVRVSKQTSDGTWRPLLRDQP